MGGTDKGKDREMPGKKNKEDVSEAIISKLLNDFNSAAVLRGSLDSNSNSNGGGENIGYEEIASSLKKLHLRKPANSRQKFKERKSQAKKVKTSAGNKYNLSVAAVNVQRPVVWPGKLNNSSKKDDVSLLQPSKLSLGGKEEEVATPASLKSIVNTSSVEEKSRIESALKKQNIQQFGRLSQSGRDEHFPSFSNLSKRHSKAEALPETTGSESMPSSSSSAKRPYHHSCPVAKHPRLYNEIHFGSDIAQCLDYRRSYAYEDNNNGNCSVSPTGKRYEAAGETLLSEENKLCSASAVEDQRLSSPSSSTVNATSATSSDSDITTSSYDEARMDESNVNELASYFDDLLHIPKKMSVMAEMMYA